MPSCIAPLVQGHAFNFRPGMIPLLPTFHGMESENPYLFIREFDEVCSTFHEPHCPIEVIRFKLFPFALKEKAKMWLNALRVGIITSWQGMETEFLKKFFPMHRTNSYKKLIMNFREKEGETFYACWDRFKDLLNACPHHGYEDWRLVNFFYDALSSRLK